MHVTCVYARAHKHIQTHTHSFHKEEKGKFWKTISVARDFPGAKKMAKEMTSEDEAPRHRDELPRLGPWEAQVEGEP